MNDTIKHVVLTKLAQSEGPKSQSLLDKEYTGIKVIISSSRDFMKIEEALERLKIFAFRMPDDASSDLAALLIRLDSAELEIPEPALFREYYSNAALQEKAIELLSSLRYLALDQVTDTLFSLCNHENEKVRKSALKELGNVAEFDLEVFKKIGPSPQIALLNKIESFSKDRVKTIGNALLSILSAFLASSISGYTWGYDKVTITSGSIPRGREMEDLRAGSLEMLKRIYFFDELVTWRLSVINVLEDATRTYSAGAMSDDSLKMIASNTVDVLNFYKSLLQDADLQLVQKIEHNAYWHFYHSVGEDVSNATLDIEKDIANLKEYQIYRDLIGFEGIFGDWRQSKKEREPRGSFFGQEREEIAINWAQSVTKENFDEWRNRVLLYVKTDFLDLATFPIFYIFAENLTRLQPEMSLEFIREHDEELRPILIPALRGLWNSEVHANLRNLLAGWVVENRNLHECCKLFRSTTSVDEEIFESIVQRARENKDVAVLTEVVVVVADRFDRDSSMELNKHFLTAMGELTKLRFADWVQQVWFSPKKKGFFSCLNRAAKGTVLKNLIHLNKIDYHAEEVLAQLGKPDIEDIIDFFGERSKVEKGRQNYFDYEAIPFQFHSLYKDLARDANAIVSKVRNWYDGNYGMFVFRGAKFLSNVFPTISSDFENALLQLISSHKKDDLAVVLAVLRNYEGEEFTHPICQELVKALPVDDELLIEVRVALGQTGVVSGEFGFANAYERKAEQMASWLESDDEKVRDFANKFITSLNNDAAQERIRAMKDVELRKFKYGVNES